jgi:hypothetical protein
MIWIGSLSGQSFGFQPFHIFAHRDLLLFRVRSTGVRWTECVVGVILLSAPDMTFRKRAGVGADVLILLSHPHIVFMTTWKPKPREQAKTKAELQEMLAKAVRNTQPQAEPKPLPKHKKRLPSARYSGSRAPK